MKKLLLALTLLSSLPALSNQQQQQQELQTSSPRSWYSAQQQERQTSSPSDWYSARTQPEERNHNAQHHSQRNIYYFSVQNELVECSKGLVDRGQKNNDECQVQLDSFYEAGATSREAIDSVKLGIELGINERTKDSNKPSFNEIVEIISLEDEA